MKRYIFLISLIILGGMVYAQKASKAEALSVALDFMKGNAEAEASSGVQKMPARIQASNGPQISEISVTGQSSLYMIGVDDQTIFMNTDRRLPAVVAQIEGRVDNLADLPEPFLDYLGFWETVRTPNTEYFIEDEWKNQENGGLIVMRVDPLLITSKGEVNWRQRGNNGGGGNEKIYNKFCPAGIGDNNYNGHCLAGCGAVAMAQVLWYWEWPYALPLDHLHEYKWDKMPAGIYNDYRYYDENGILRKKNSTQEEVDQIAWLLRHCGQKADMQYDYKIFGQRGSFCWAKDIADAFDDFDFNANKEICLNTNPSMDKHEEKIIYNLRCNRPVIATGTSSQKEHLGAHHFVIDGWKRQRGVDWFHINWGWGVQNEKKECEPDSRFWCRIRNFDSESGKYNWFKRFIYDIYPKWRYGYDPIAIKNKSLGRFQISNRGSIDVQNVKVSSDGRGYIISRDGIHLSSGCHIAAGSEVYIGANDLLTPQQREYQKANSTGSNKIRRRQETGEEFQVDSVMEGVVFCENKTQRMPNEPVFMVKKDEPTVQVSTGLSSQSVLGPVSAKAVRKVREAGQIFIIKNSQKYDMKGVLVENTRR